MREEKKTEGALGLGFEVLYGDRKRVLDPLSLGCRVRGADGSDSGTSASLGGAPLQSSLAFPFPSFSSPPNAATVSR